MKRAYSGEEMQDFYDRWEAVVFTFCRFYLGDENCAETTTLHVFRAYFDSGLLLDGKRLPAALLRLVLEASRRWVVLDNGGLGPPAFEEMLLALPDAELAVLLLHGILGLDFPWISTMNGLTNEEGQRLWLNSLLHLQSQLCHGKGSPIGFVPSIVAELRSAAAQC